MRDRATAAVADDTMLVALNHWQAEELRATERTVVHLGGYGSGKTYLDAWLILMHSGAVDLSALGVESGFNRAVLGGLFAHESKQLLLAVLGSEVFPLLDQFGVEYTYGRMPPPAWRQRWLREGFRGPALPARAYSNVLVLENGHHVFCSALYQEHYRALKTFSFGYAIIEEASEIKEEAVAMVNSRLRDARAGRVQLYVHTNPAESADHWLFEWCDRVRRSADSGGAPAKFLRSSTRDNVENLSPDYLDLLLGSIPAELVRARVDGHMVRTGPGGAYSSFDEDLSVIAGVAYRPAIPLYVSFDFNWSPAVAGLYQLDSRGLVKIDEVHLEAGGTRAVCAEILRRYPPHRVSSLAITWDATGGRRTSSSPATDHEIIRQQLGTMYRPVRYLSDAANPEEIDRVNAVNGALLDGLGRRWYRIASRCERTIRDYRRVSYVPGTRRLNKVADLSLTHHSDADGYLIWKLRPMFRTTKMQTRAVQ